MPDEEEEQTGEPAIEPEPEPEPEPAAEPNWPGARPKQAAFLTALVFHAGHHGKAARAAHISRQSHYKWMKGDQHYRALHTEAMEQVTVVLEDEALRRSMEGTKKGVYYQGVQCGTEVVHSDGLMMFMLRAAAPDKYRERSEVKGSVDLNLKFAGTMEELLALYREVVSRENADGSPP